MPTCIRCHYIYSDTINLCIYIKSAHPSSVPPVKLVLCNYVLPMFIATNYRVILHVTKSTYASSDNRIMLCLMLVCCFIYPSKCHESIKEDIYRFESYVLLSWLCKETRCKCLVTYINQQESWQDEVFK